MPKVAQLGTNPRTYFEVERGERFVTLNYYDAFGNEYAGPMVEKWLWVAVDQRQKQLAKLEKEFAELQNKRDDAIKVIRGMASAWTEFAFGASRRTWEDRRDANLLRMNAVRDQMVALRFCEVAEVAW